MKKLPALVGIGFIVFVSSLAPPAEADLLEFSDTNIDEQRINHNGFYPVARFELQFPNGEGAPWSYDDQYDLGNIEDLIITLTGEEYFGGDPIDMFLSFIDDPSGPSDWTNVASVEPLDYGPQSNYTNFSIALDIGSQQWTLTDRYGNTNMGSMVGEAVDYDDFYGQDSFWVGYGCHFTHLSTGVYVSAREEFVPEPATLSLFGIGLIGLGVLRKKRK